ncbi:M56 family metallopeptidase [Occallatibacter savannae]|uniref:M56 family metallopeptidase n=1 Tax=Occallatibacter savannae TaxID=1002691 RepID=UPI000D699957|nr:M56 family metallopeptidase [Occallatibacter savannae]
MTSNLVSILRDAGTPIANHLWQSTVFVAAIGILTLFFANNRAQIRYALWLAASAKFLIPFSALIAIGSLIPVSKHAVPLLQPALISAVRTIDQPFPAPFVAQHVNTQSILQRMEGWLPAVLMLIWALGAATVLLIWYARWRQVSKMLQRSVPANESRESVILRRIESSTNSRTRIRVFTSKDLTEPGVIGIFRPALLWPAQLSDRLDDEHLEAILAHEVAHVRRQDNLVAAIHLLVEAIFWFHPFVWWIERKMIEERERACDEAVLQSGSPADVYADSLLKVSRYCAEIQLAFVSGITGSDLSKRVRSIMVLIPERLSMGRKIALGMFCFVVTAAPVAFGVMRLIPLSTQVLHANGPLPSFEVATIKPLEGAPPPMPGGPPPLAPDEVRLFANTRVLISIAYNVQGFDKSEIIGGPAWLDNQIYEVHAKISAPLSKAMQQMPDRERDRQINLMEQSLLAERFKLKAHFETRQLAELALVAAKRGPTLTRSDPSLPRNGATRLSNGQSQELKSTGSTIQDLIQMLQSEPETGGRPILDKTGLTDSYDFTLKWTQDQTPDASSSQAGNPSLFTALEEQLGLKLIPTKGPVQVVVIDSIERPSPN